MNRIVTACLSTSLSLVATLSAAVAAAPRTAESVACMAMRETDETRAGNLPSMRAEPRADAPAVGVIGGVVFVRQPRQDRDGYTLVVRRDWVEGWVVSSWLKPWGAAALPGAKCAPMLAPDGMLAWKVVPRAVAVREPPR